MPVTLAGGSGVRMAGKRSARMRADRRQGVRICTDDRALNVPAVRKFGAVGRRCTKTRRGLGLGMVLTGISMTARQVGGRRLHALPFGCVDGVPVERCCPSIVCVPGRGVPVADGVRFVHG